MWNLNLKIKEESKREITNRIWDDYYNAEKVEMKKEESCNNFVFYFESNDHWDIADSSDFKCKE